MTHRLDQRVSKLESGTQDERTEWLLQLPFEDLERLGYLAAKLCFEGLSDDERVEIDALSFEPYEDGPYKAGKEYQALIDNAAMDKLEYRPFASGPVWLEDRNHIYSAVGKIAYAVEHTTLPADINEDVLPLIEKLREAYYPYGYKWLLSDEEIDKVAEALSDVDLGPEQPWFREYFKAYAEEARPIIEQRREYGEREQSDSVQPSSKAGEPNYVG